MESHAVLESCRAWQREIEAKLTAHIAGAKERREADAARRNQQQITIERLTCRITTMGEELAAVKAQVAQTAKASSFHGSLLGGLIVGTAVAVLTFVLGQLG